MKKLFFILFLCISLNANVNQAVLGILGNSEYNTHKNLINHVFKNSNSFYTAGSLDYTKISQQLSSNNLPKLNLGRVQDIDVTFQFNKTSKIALKNVSDILKVIGQQDFVTTSQVVIGNQLKWSVKIKTAAAINPLRLSQELQSADCKILDIKKEGINKWSYYIDSSRASVYKAEDLINNKEVLLKRPTKPYIVKVNNTSLINIVSNAGNSWYPKIIFYDNEFNIIESVDKDTLHTSLKTVVPSGTKFIKIDDFYALTNIKNGLTVTKE